ncbi:transporter substrate-binding domain-containing protein [Clostridium tarantellae]|uniref:Transporter substrate-binding domain-containing protein n=1 Tax=Clostridium tarantellae TaxID=39493 RepID=A0A6I1MKE2_9CLOT|nr:transporter substrate-binding domain-containing protein [Clostridium tarantellae]MPQ43183.1 transporter substrate-binding domain-containing protein [Clostridium tarantellae]
MHEKTKYIIKISILIFIMIIATIGVFYNRNNLKTTLDKNDLIIGMELKFPPFETVDSKGNPLGVSVELAKAIGEKLGKKVEIKNIDYSSLIPALQSKNIDLIISSMSITEERLKSIDFSDEYAKSDLALVINNSKTINNFKELNNSKYIIAAKQGTAGSLWVKQNLPKAKLKDFTEVSAAMLDVNNGNSSAFIYDPLSLIEGSKNLSNIKLLLNPLPNVKGWAIGMRKGDERLKYKINEALKSLKEEGFFEKIREKYLKDDVEKYKSYGLDYFF